MAANGGSFPGVTMLECSPQTSLKFSDQEEQARLTV
jgi:hypothetical protein